MAITIDAVTDKTNGTTSNNNSDWQHTCAVGASILLVGYCFGNDVTPTCTYNGVSMTQIGYSVQNVSTVLFALINPPSGAHTIQLNWGSNSRNAGGAISFLGTDGYRSEYGATGTDNAPTVTVVDSENGDFVFDTLSINNNNGSETEGAGQTAKWNKNFGGSNQAAATSSIEEASGASTVMSWSSSANGSWALRAIALIPAGAFVPRATVMI